VWLQQSCLQERNLSASVLDVTAIEGLQDGAPAASAGGSDGGQDFAEEVGCASASTSKNEENAADGEGASGREAGKESEQEDAREIGEIETDGELQCAQDVLGGQAALARGNAGLDDGAAAGPDASLRGHARGLRSRARGKDRSATSVNGEAARSGVGGESVSDFRSVFCPSWGHLKDSLLALARYQNPRLERGARAGSSKQLEAGGEQDRRQVPDLAVHESAGMVALPLLQSARMEGVAVEEGSADKPGRASGSTNGAQDSITAGRKCASDRVASRRARQKMAPGDGEAGLGEARRGEAGRAAHGGATSDDAASEAGLGAAQGAGSTGAPFSWEDKRHNLTGLTTLYNVVKAGCPNHLIIDTRRREEFEESHMWYSLQVAARSFCPGVVCLVPCCPCVVCRVLAASRRGRGTAAPHTFVCVARCQSLGGVLFIVHVWVMCCLGDVLGDVLFR